MEKSKERNNIEITERKKAEEALKESEEQTRIFASYQHAISELRKFYAVDATIEQMIQKTLDLIIEEFGYYMAWYAELIEKEKVILPKLWAGKYEKYLDGLRLEYESDKRDAKCAMSLAILTKKPFGYADLEHDKDFEKWRTFALQYGYRSNQAIPLIVGGECKSAFLIYSTRPFAFSERLVEYLKGIVDELATIIENITKHKRLIEELEKKIRYTDNIIKSMIDTLIVVDPDAKIKTINKATSDLIGYKEDELIGKPVGTIFAEEEEEEEEEVTPFKGTRLKRLIKEGSIRDYDMTYRTKSGEKIPVSFSGSVMRDKEGELVGIVGIARDMREIKRLMQREKELAAQAAAAEAERKRAAELDKAYKDLKNAQKQLIQSEKLASIGQLATGAAHEIDNPLFVISGEAEMLLKDKYKDKDTKDASKIIVEQAKRIRSITERLLEFSRRKEPKLEPLDINNALEKSISLLSYQNKMEGIEIVKELDPNLPKPLGDSDQIQEAFLNIMLNAVQAMEKGGRLTIRTRCEKITKYGRRKTDIFKLGQRIAVIEFKDTGRGMDEETLKKVFDPFFTTREKSTGLGLSICYGIIENHKGIIEADSKIGEGSTFVVKLPIPKEGER